jgi:hypothetical protein
MASQLIEIYNKIQDMKWNIKITSRGESFNFKDYSREYIANNMPLLMHYFISGKDVNLL